MMNEPLVWFPAVTSVILMVLRLILQRFETILFLFSAFLTTAAVCAGFVYGIAAEEMLDWLLVLCVLGLVRVRRKDG